MLCFINSCVTRADRVLFLDRDGVINRDSPDYIKSREEFLFYPDTPAAFELLGMLGIGIVVVSNQSGLARGYSTITELAAIHDAMTLAAKERGANILAGFYCPHHPDAGCRCRKPMPEMIRYAIALYNISPEKSFMIGDKPSDVEAGERAGCRGIRLVRRENGVSPGSTLSDLVSTLFDSECRPGRNMP